MDVLTKLKYVKELKGFASQDLQSLPVLEKLKAVKRIKELIELLGGTVGNKADEQNPPSDGRGAAYVNPAPTHVSPTTSRTNVGAEGNTDSKETSAETQETQEPAKTQRQKDIEVLNAIIDKTAPNMDTNGVKWVDQVVEIMGRNADDEEITNLSILAVNVLIQVICEFFQKNYGELVQKATAGN